MLRKLFTQQLILLAYHHLKSGCILLRLKTYLQTLQLRLMAMDEGGKASLRVHLLFPYTHPHLRTKFSFSTLLRSARPTTATLRDDTC